MLYKNDAPYKLAPNDLKVITEKFKRFPLKIIYPPERVVKSRSPQNRLPDKPNSVSFPLSATVKTNIGADHWRYAENVIIKEHGVKKYTPKSLRFNGLLTLEDKDVELAWFLYTKSIHCKEGLNYQGKGAKFMFEDLISDAERKADGETVRTKVKSLIYGEDLGLSEDRMRALAKAYFIRNVDLLSFAQVKIAIEHAIGRDGKNGLQRFIEMTNMDEFIKVRMRMQNLVDAGKLKYDTGKKEWQWTQDGKKIESICKVAPGGNPNDIIYDYYIGNKDFQEVIEAVEKSKKVKV